jgi:hypothetical protein
MLLVIMRRMLMVVSSMIPLVRAAVNMGVGMGLIVGVLVHMLVDMGVGIYVDIVAVPVCSWLPLMNPPCHRGEWRMEIAGANLTSSL